MPNTNVLLECIAKTAVKYLVKGAVNWATFGIGGTFVIDVWDSWEKVASEEKRRKELQELTQPRAPQEPPISEKVMREVVSEQTGLPDWKRIWLDSYLKLIPARARLPHEPRIENPKTCRQSFLWSTPSE